MGDSRRFVVFTKEIQNKFLLKKYKKIADIAGGKSYLNYELKKIGYSVTTYDKRKVKRNNITFKYCYFNEKIKDNHDLLVGMHPNEATDIIITQAAKRNIPFIIVHCCIKPTDTVLFQNYNYKTWIHHLDMYARKLGFITFKKQINITGKNIMLWGIRK